EARVRIAADHEELVRLEGDRLARPEEDVVAAPVVGLLEARAAACAKLARLLDDLLGRGRVGEDLTRPVEERAAIEAGPGPERRLLGALRADDELGPLLHCVEIAELRPSGKLLEGHEERGGAREAVVGEPRAEALDDPGERAGGERSQGRRRDLADRACQGGRLPG